MSKECLKMNFKSSAVSEREGPEMDYIDFTNLGLENDHDLAFAWQVFFTWEAGPTDYPVSKVKCRPKPKSKKRWVGGVRLSRRNLEYIRRHFPEDRRLELADPTPDVQELYEILNVKYFNGRLRPALVKWSPRLTSTAAYTKYDGTCMIVLSAPLLSLRPRINLVETLVHEMIHAYLFHCGSASHQNHGEDFLREMARINKKGDIHVTAVHGFHQETDYLKQYWWRCDGPCKYQPPHFGLVRRAVRCPPSSNSRWWARHLTECGGTFRLVRSKKEPYVEFIKHVNRRHTKRKVTFSKHRAVRMLDGAERGYDIMEEVGASGYNLKSDGTHNGLCQRPTSPCKKKFSRDSPSKGA